MFSVKVSKKIATLSDAMFTIYRIAFRADTKRYPVKHEHQSNMWLSTLQIGAARLQKSRWNNRSYVLTEALYPVWFCCRRKSCPV